MMEGKKRGEKCWFPPPYFKSMAIDKVQCPIPECSIPALDSMPSQ